MSGRISQERLNEIAGHRLARLGLQVRPGKSGALEGVLELKRVQVPGSGGAIGAAPFVVVSHDQVRFTAGPLASLAPVPFYDCPSVAELEQRVGAAVIARVSDLRTAAGPLARLKVPASIDTDRLVVFADVQIVGTTVRLEAQADGVRVTRIEGRSGTLDVPSSVPPLDLSGLDDATDLELYLGGILPNLQEAARSAPPPAAPTPAGAPASVSPLVPVPPPGEAMPLSLVVSRFGPTAVVTGAELVADYQSEGGGYRLVARITQGTHAAVSIFAHSNPHRELFADTIDLARAPALVELVATVVGTPASTTTAPAAPAAATAAATSANEVAPYLMPRPGEVWVMTALVERDDGKEVRYVLVDPDGRPSGAARVLPREEFTRVFFESRGSYALQIIVDAVDGGQVHYRQLDAQRVPAAEVRAMPVTILVATFEPEAARYG